MSKAGERILKSARAARAYARGEIAEGFVAHVPDDIDVRAVRKKLDLTREAFAKRFGLSVDAVKEWEMGRRKPERATRVLLKVIDREPEAVKRALEIA
jgi:putative transcriptional regulator